MKSREKLVEAWGFLIGVVLAVIVGLFKNYIDPNTSTIIYAVLVLLGLLIGLLNITGKDTVNFLLASLSLVIVSGMGQYTLVFISNLSPVLGYLSSILSALLVMFVPATIVVALKTVFAIANN